MRLSKEDKVEFLRAAYRAPDLKSLADWIAGVVDAFDDLPPGKADVPCPRFATSRAVAPASAWSAEMPMITNGRQWEDTPLA